MPNSKPPPTEGLAFHRFLLILISVVLPSLGAMAWSLGSLNYDVMAVRLGIAGTCLAWAAATFVHEGARRNVRNLVNLAGWVLFGWFSFIAFRNGLTVDDAIGLLPCSMIAPMTSRRTSEVVAFIVFQAVCIGSLALLLAEPAFPIPVLAVMEMSIAAGLGGASVSRAGLVGQLRDVNERLEERVADRTAELLASLGHAEAESLERAQAERAAVRASQAKSAFLANMSHELRTPLNAVLGYTEMVSEELAEQAGQDALVADLDRAQHSARHLQALIDDVLDLSRIEADELQLEVCPVPLTEVVTEALSVGPDLATPGRRLEVEIPDNLWVSADKGRLCQVLLNLLANAHKFTPQGHITVRASAQGERVQIDVSDSGVGIAANLLPTIFDRFTQADASSTRAHGGSGLGLAISKQLVDRMGGRIEVQSTEGVGSVFSVWLVPANPL